MSAGSAHHLSRRMAIVVFLVFALGYFFSTLVRAITATLSPVLTQELGLQARDLGLLAGGYFLGFSLTQLPLGKWLDRYGPRRVVLAFLSVAVLGCIAFSRADSFSGLLLARVLCGVGVSACLMAPLTGYRRWVSLDMQLRANAWMLMAGALGMVSSTLPVQWLLPLWGWRNLFVALAVCIVLVMLSIRMLVPAWQRSVPVAQTADMDNGGYGEIWRNRYFWRMAPLGFFCYGGVVAIQTLWAGPWMTQVAGWSALESASGLFLINVCMLITFWLWGWITPALARRGIHANQLITWSFPLSMVMLSALVLLGPVVGDAAAPLLAAFCVASSSLGLAQPAVGMAFASHLVGRALSAYNLVVFAGVFVVQWGIGLGIDLARSLGLQTVQAHQAAFGVFGVCSLLAWGFFMGFRKDNGH